jgi:predicted acyltransferase
MKNTPIQSTRLLSLDVLRGITIAGMILVNNPGSWSFVYAPLGHAQWNGLTPTDLVFPFFMFIMGVSMFFSYQKFDFKLTKDTFVKLLRRSVLLFLIGLALGWLSMSMRKFNVLEQDNLNFGVRLWESVSNLENLRIHGVLQRLALVSFIGTLLILTIKYKFIPWLTVLILIGYWLLIALTNSYEMSPDSIIAITDNFLFGETHLYKDTMADGTRIAFDPEGLISTIPCIAHVLIGFLVGKLIHTSKDLQAKMIQLFIWGTVLTFSGFLLDYGFGINKKIWSSSYVLVTTGLASLLLGLLIYIIDYKGQKKWSIFFESFGVNPMMVYVFGALLTILTGNILFNYHDSMISLKSFFFGNILQPALGDYPASLVSAIIFVLISWLFGHYLYKKKIYIKL